MAQDFTPARRQRFRKLLTLAAESPFVGEREAALAAAERMAEAAGLDLEEAARACGRDEPEPRPEPAPQGPRATQEEGWPEDLGPNLRRAAWTGYAWEAAASRARQRHREEVARRQREEEAQRREERGRRRRGGGTRSDRAMARGDFARVLLLETGLPLRDIADITELGMYEVVGLKLKLRPEIARVRARRAAAAEPPSRRAAGLGAP